MILDLLNPSNWFGYRAKLSGGLGNPDSPRGDAGATYAQKPVTIETALQLAAFWACVRLTAQTVGTLPLFLYEKQANGGRAIAATHPVAGLIHDSPNADQTPVEFWEGVTAWLLTWGDAYAEKFVNGGQVRALTLLRSDRMTPYRTPSGELRYRYTGAAATRDYAQAEIFHVRGFGFGGDRGLSAVQYGRQTIASAAAADETAGSTFANGMRPSGWFKYKGTANGGILKPEQRDQAKRVLVDPYSGAGNTAKTGILEGDFDWIAASLPPKDTELLDTRRFNTEEICRWFGIPPVLVGHSAEGQTMWGSGVEQIMLAWLTLSLRSLLRRIQAAARRDLLTPVDRPRFYPEFNVDALLQADSKSRAELLAKRVQNGLMNRNEAREHDNLGPYDGGDTFTVQANLIPVDQLGKVAVQPDEKPIGAGDGDTQRQ